ncbi:MAG: C1 family peptidase [Elusimicrobia bacterium]|nr:C1 family peptidase [Elusimicrobiota bacterium]
MRDRLRAAALIVLSLAAAATAGRAQDLCEGKSAELQKAIAAHGAKWVVRLPGAEPTMTGLELAPIEAPFLPLTEAAAAVLPKRFDWREHHAVSGVRDQGACGSCWAFSMTQALESQVMIANKSSEDPKLSEQVMISCSGVGSCNGGKMNAAFLQNVGLPPESDYPYTAADGSCGDAKSGWRQRARKIGSWYSVPHNLAAIKSALVAHGPLPITLDLRQDMKYYQSGVYTYIKGDEWGCGGKDSAGRDNDDWGWHAVLLVGFDDAGQYFIVKNSWSPRWGENGYFRIAYSDMFTKAFFGNEALAFVTTPAESEGASSDVLPGSLLGSTAETGAGGPQCRWNVAACGVCSCQSTCLYCKADPSIVACAGAQPRCPIPKMITGLQVRAEPGTLTSDSPVTLTASLSFTESVTVQEKQQVTVEFSADGAGAASVGFGAGSAAGPFKANVDANGSAQVSVSLIPNVAAVAPQSEDKKEAGPNSEVRDHAGEAFDTLDAEAAKATHKAESPMQVGAPMAMQLTGVVMLPPALRAAPGARLSQAVDVKVEANENKSHNHVSLHVQANIPGSSQPRLAEASGDDLTVPAALAIADTVIPKAQAVLNDTTGLDTLISKAKQYLSSYASPPPLFKTIGHFGNQNQYRLDLEITGVYPRQK